MLLLKKEKKMDQLENLFSTKMIVRSIINVCLDENEFSALVSREKGDHWSLRKNSSYFLLNIVDQ